MRTYTFQLVWKRDDGKEYPLCRDTIDNDVVHFNQRGEEPWEPIDFDIPETSPLSKEICALTSGSLCGRMKA